MNKENLLHKSFNEIKEQIEKEYFYSINNFLDINVKNKTFTCILYEYDLHDKISKEYYLVFIFNVLEDMRELKI